MYWILKHYRINQYVDVKEIPRRIYDMFWKESQRNVLKKSKWFLGINFGRILQEYKAEFRKTNSINKPWLEFQEYSDLQ